MPRGSLRRLVARIAVIGALALSAILLVAPRLQPRVTWFLDALDVGLLALAAFLGARRR